MLKKLLSILLITACSQVCAADPSEQFLSAYQAYQQGEKAERDGNSTEALKRYRFAESLLVEITTKDPAWQKSVIEYRLKKTRDGVARLQASGGADESSSSLPSAYQESSGLETRAQGPSITIVPPDTSAASPAVQPKSVADSSAEVRRLKKQIDGLKSDLQEAREALTSQKNRSKDLDAAKWEEERKKLDKDLLEAKDQVANLSDRLKKRDSWEKDIKDLQRRLDDALADKAATEELYQQREKKMAAAAVELTRQLEEARQKVAEGSVSRQKLEGLSKEVESGRESIKQLQGKLEQAELKANESLAKNTLLQNQVNEVSSKLADAQKQAPELDSLRSKIKSLQEESGVLRQDLKRSGEQVASLEVSARKSTAEARKNEDALRADLMAVEEDRKRISDQASRLSEAARDTAKVKGLQQDAEELKKSVAQLQEQLAIAQKNGLEARSQADLLQKTAKETAAITASKIKKMESDSSILEEERQLLTAKLSDATGKVADLGKQNEALVTKSKEIEQLKAQMDENAKALEQAKTKLASTEGSNTAERAKSEAALKKLQAASDLERKQRADAEAEKAVLEEERQQLGMKLAEATGKVADLGKQNEALAAKSKEMEQLKGRLEENAKALEQAKTKLADNEGANAVEKAEAQRKLLAAKSLKEALEQQNASLQEQLKGTLSRMAGLVDQGMDQSPLKEQLKSLQQQMDLNAKNYAESQRRLEEMSKARPEQEKVLRDKEKSLADARAEAEKLRTDLVAANQNVTTLQQQSSQGEDRLKKLQEQLAEMSKKSSTGASAADDLRKAEEKLRAELAEAKEKIASLQGKGAALKELEVKLADKEAELTRLRKKKSKAGSVADENTSEENSLLRGIVLRQVKEEARRAQASRLMEEEMKRLNVQSQSLTEQINVLSAPSINLTPKERALFKEGQLVIADDGAGKLQASVSAPMSQQDKPPGNDAKVDEVKNEQGSPTNTATPQTPGQGETNASNQDMEWQGKFKQCLAKAKEEFDRQDYLQAESSFRDALGYSPDDYFALSNLGVVEFQLGKLKEAEELLLKASQKTSDSSFALTTLGIVHYRQERLADAEKVLRKAIVVNQQDFTAHNYLGIVLAASGKGGAGESEIMKALEINPQYADAHFNLAVIYATGKPPAKMMAKKHYAKAIGLGAPPDPSLEHLFQ
jgi:predicted  nucleic acid-binding Zn-ribbon protein